MSQCRSCDAEIVWCVSRNGKKMPLDAEPSSEGDFDLGPGDPPEAIFKGKANGEYTCHFETCPDASNHRAPKPDRATQECPKCKHRFVGK